MIDNYGANLDAGSDRTRRVKNNCLSQKIKIILRVIKFRNIEIIWNCLNQFFLVGIFLAGYHDLHVYKV